MTEEKTVPGSLLPYKPVTTFRQADWSMLLEKWDQTWFCFIQTEVIFVIVICLEKKREHEVGGGEE